MIIFPVQSLSVYVSVGLHVWLTGSSMSTDFSLHSFIRFDCGGTEDWAAACIDPFWR